MSSSVFTATQRGFMASERFAIVGASKDESKFGTKLLKWYINHGKSVTPLHPKEDALEGLTTVRKVSELPSPSTTSLSIVTPAKITLGILDEAVKANVPFIWIQPGAEDEAVVEFINSTPGLKDKVVFGGPCVLRSGEEILKSLGL